MVLKSAVVNPDLVTDINYRINGATINQQIFTGGENEIVSYVIYQTPAINITTGTQSVFTLLGDFEGSFVYYPNATDPLAFSLGDSLNVRNYNDNQKVRASIAQHTDMAQSYAVVEPSKYKETKAQMANLVPMSEEMHVVNQKSGWDTVRSIAKNAVKYGKYPAAV